MYKLAVRALFLFSGLGSCLPFSLTPYISPFAPRPLIGNQRSQPTAQMMEETVMLLPKMAPEEPSATESSQNTGKNPFSPSSKDTVNKISDTPNPDFPLAEPTNEPAQGQATQNINDENLPVNAEDPQVNQESSLVHKETFLLRDESPVANAQSPASGNDEDSGQTAISTENSAQISTNIAPQCPSQPVALPAPAAATSADPAVLGVPSSAELIVWPFSEHDMGGEDKSDLESAYCVPSEGSTWREGDFSELLEREAIIGN